MSDMTLIFYRASFLPKKLDDRLEPGAGAFSAKLIGRERSFKTHILAGWFRTSNSGSCRAQFDRKQSLEAPHVVTASGRTQSVTDQ